MALKTKSLTEVLSLLSCSYTVTQIAGTNKYRILPSPALTIKVGTETVALPLSAHVDAVDIVTEFKGQLTGRIVKCSSKSLDLSTYVVT